MARFLLDWKISADFNPAGRAPETEGLIAMRALHVSEERDDLENAIETHACAIIGPDLLDVTYLNSLVVMEGKELPKTRTLGHILSDMGYRPVDGRRIKINKTRANHYVWIRPQALRPKEGSLSTKDPKAIVRDFHNGDGGFDDTPF